MALTVGEVIQLAKDAKNQKDKVEVLRKHDTYALREYLKLAYDNNIKFALPETPPPYKPNDCPTGMGDTRLATEIRKMYLYVEGGHKTLKQSRRELLFIQLLEALDAQESSFLVECTHKKIAGLSKAAVDAAFPDLKLVERFGADKEAHDAKLNK